MNPEKAAARVVKIETLPALPDLSVQLGRLAQELGHELGSDPDVGRVTALQAKIACATDRLEASPPTSPEYHRGMAVGALCALRWVSSAVLREREAVSRRAEFSHELAPEDVK